MSSSNGHAIRTGGHAPDHVADHAPDHAADRAASPGGQGAPVAHLLHEGLPLPPSATAPGPEADAVPPWMADPLPPEILCGLPGWRDDLAACAGFVPISVGSVPMLAASSGAEQGGDAPSGGTPLSLASTSSFPPVIVCGPCTSSLDVAHALAAAGALPEWGAVLAVSQRAGRGQLRRPWESPPGNIYAAWRLPASGVFATEAAAIALGCMFAESFAALGVPVQLKWPNDLLLADAKIGGMLIEERRGVVLAGIGINLVSAPPPQALRQGWAVPAASLAGRGISATPLTLWRHLVGGALFCYEAQVLRAGGADFVSCAEKHLAWVGRGVVVHGGDVGDCPGRILGLEPQGGLRIVISGREHILRSGSITPIPS
ncbi:biotin--[acetyl-CoA-carboxylase] ligase [Nitratidesulfovibrio sp. D1]|uniref:biotin--[acetyl-CoA-carboxylase] ligase n=1 Tax=Nitratidesulfovibrio sp. D1 TaxID=3440151 RepID=UPI003EBCA34C